MAHRPQSPLQDSSSGCRPHLSPPGLSLPRLDTALPLALPRHEAVRSVPLTQDEVLVPLHAAFVAWTLATQSWFSPRHLPTSQAAGLTDGSQRLEHGHLCPCPRQTRARCTMRTDNVATGSFTFSFETLSRADVTSIHTKQALAMLLLSSGSGAASGPQGTEGLAGSFPPTPPLPAENPMRSFPWGPRGRERPQGPEDGFTRELWMKVCDYSERCLLPVLQVLKPTNKRGGQGQG